MAAAEMGAVMGTSFDQLGKFMGENRVTPLAVEVGFPVAEDDLAKAAGNINAGETPAGHAVKTVHRGPYETLKVTYKALENDLKTRGIVMGKVGWEIYFGEPATTPADRLVTEIYIQISDEDAGKLAA